MAITKHTNIDELLAAAYRIDQMQKDRRAAIDLVRKALDDDPIIEPHLRDKHRQFKNVHAARSFTVADCGGDHVSKVMGDLLDRVFP